MLNKIKKTADFIKNFALKHKIISLIIVLCVLIGGYWEYSSLSNTSGVTRYVLAEATKTTIISSVAGTGQTAAANELTIKPKTSGDLTAVAVVGGQTINRGDLIARIDTTNAQQALDNAQQALDQANVALEKMKGVQTSLGKLRGVTEKAQDDLNTAYENGFNTVTNAFLSLPTIMTGLQGILFDTTLSANSQNIDYYTSYANIYNDIANQYGKNANSSYQVARTSYNKTFSDFKTTNRTSDVSQIELLISETYDTAGKISQSIKDAINLIQLYQDEFTKHNIPMSPVSNTHLSSLNGYVNTTNNYLSSLLTIKTTIETDKENLIQTSYDITDQQNLVANKQATLDDAKKTLSDCYIYAPFSGIVSTVSSKVGDSVSSGTAIANIITKDVIANISLNEVDASKVKLGQKVTTTFDAIDGLTLTGVVSSIDTVGTVSQGVVSYNVEINFDTQDARVKPGMSTSVNIITQTKQDVLTVPNGAIKTKGGATYVLILDKKQELTSSTASQGFISAITPTQKTVQIGIADDTNTEIINGLSEGDQVITRTIAGTTTATASGASSATGASRTTRTTTQGLFSAGGGGIRPGN